ncbi:sporulation protein YtfJ [Hydrogenoanaerobacterium saccharovorans]|uniref:Sporulation protein YtfJ n=1 Tax=Hydrogenoanaerobacterium saccharovorans TaxID=474960 RepID=A0A1H8D3U2_9FIRM|nr:GerW family sporulation protein [Hydrogenoanaerobacterium saccharovorans]RPF43470.1 sporulation protein YtfJ [Hydrogenoanaerobacterium saccharovorans]SEN01822.1 sporulation protein YtfJ [Hydrogenoanaerobacterium saccharovorans]
MSQSQGHIEGILNSSLENLKTLVDVNTIIGDQIITPDGTVVIPVSKVTFGFASGGSDLPTSKPKDMFGGGSGAGVTIQPLAFLVISPNGNVKMLQMEKFDGSVDRAVNMVPEVIDKVASMFNKPKKSAESPAAKPAE